MHLIRRKILLLTVKTGTTGVPKAGRLRRRDRFDVASARVWLGAAGLFTVWLEAGLLD